MLRRAVLLAAALGLAACGGHARPRIVKARSLPGSYVAADGHRVYFDCEGTGSPTVVFVSGWGVDSSSFALLLDRVGRFTRACLYDRAGTGFTKTLPAGARDAHDQVRELEQLLVHARLPAPYVLVGHSWGGALARLYAGTHDDVKGLVFVDSSSPGQDAALRAALPPERANEPALFAQLRHPTLANAVANPEHLALEKSLREVGTVTSLGDRPVAVLTSGANFGPLASVKVAWFRLQDRLAALSSRSVHAIALASGHFVQQDQPDAVVAAIRADVRAVRSGRAFRPCAAIFAHVTAVRCVS